MKRAAAPWIERYGRFGYAAKALVYIVIGILALYAAFEVSTQRPNVQNALETIFFRPFGGILLSIVTIGLFGYAGWQFVAALVDGEHDGSDVKGILLRLGKVWGALAYGVLAAQSARVLLGIVAEDKRVEALTATVMTFALGRGAIAMTGLGILVFGLYQFYQAYAAQVRQHLELALLGDHAVPLVVWLGRLGLAARGVVFVLIGAFLIRAAIRDDPQAAMGLGEALLFLERLPFGLWLLGAAAVGFIAYGVYEFFKGCYRRLDVL